MKNLLRISFALLAISFLITSCKNKSTIGSMIPSDASIVAYFNAKSLGAKYPYSEFKNQQFFKEAMADSTIPEWAKNILNNPEETGIDKDKGITFFIHVQGADNIHFVFEGSLANEANFEKYNQHFDSTQKTAEQKGIKYLTIHNKAVAAWNSNNFVYVYNVSNKQFSPEELKDNESNSLPSIPDGNINLAQNFAVHLFSLHKDSTLSKDKRFTDLIGKNGDVKVWTNMESFMNLSPSSGMMSMLKLNAFIKDTRTAYNVNFENGDIKADITSYYGKELSKLLDKYKGDKIKTDELAKIPSNDILGVIAINFNPQLLTEIVKLAGLDGFINMYGSQIGLSLDDLTSGIDGHILFSFSDVKTGDSPSFNRPDFNFLFKSGIGDQARFKKIVDALNKMAGVTDVSKVSYNMNDKTFVLSNHKKFADAYLNEKQNNKADWMDKIAGHPTGLYFNINKMFSIPNLPSDSISKAMIQKSKELWNDVIVTGNNIDKNSISATATITLMDKNTNSLKAISSYLDVIYQLEKQQEKKRKEEINFLPPSNDSAAPGDNIPPKP